MIVRSLMIALMLFFPFLAQAQDAQPSLADIEKLRDNLGERSRFDERFGDGSAELYTDGTYLSWAEISVGSYETVSSYVTDEGLLITVLSETNIGLPQFACVANVLEPSQIDKCRRLY